MKKTMTIVLVVLLAAMFISCEQAVDVMGAMGKNALSSYVDTTKVEALNDATTVKQSGLATDGKVDILGDKVSVSIVGDKLSVGTKEITLNKPVEAILPAVDNMDEVFSAFSDPATKEEALKSLNEEVNDELTKKAAQGTATVLTSILDQAGGAKAMEELGLGDVAKTLNTISDGGNVKKSDVLILQSMTAMLSSAGSIVGDAVEKEGTSIKTEDLLSESVVDKALDFADMLTMVSGSSSFGSIDVVGTLAGKLGK